VVGLALDARTMMNPLNLFLFGGLGLIVGLWHFGSLHWLSRRLMSTSGPHWGVMVPVQLLRIAMLVGSCWWTVRFGAGPLLALALGMVAARMLLIRRVRRGAASEAQA
jgi:F1F0 ATPase subunit 2